MGPIFNIFFMNKVTVGPINSTSTVLLPLQCYLSHPFCKMRKMKKKKKEKKETQTPDASFSRIQTAPKRTGERSSEDINVFVFLIVWG